MKPDVPAAAVVRVVAGEAVEARVERDFQDVPSPLREEFESRPIGPNPDDSAPRSWSFRPSAPSASRNPKSPIAR